MASYVAARRAPGRAPARAAAVVRAARRGVEAQARDHRVGVAAVRVHRDPRALAGAAPALEARRVERLLEEAAAVARIPHRAGAVVARVLPLAVAAAVAVRLGGDAVRRGDHALDLLRGVVRGDSRAAVGGETGLSSRVALRGSLARAGVAGFRAALAGRGL